MKSITVFTPTYNRAFCLGNLYQSLVRQSNQDFSWLIIDDGSEDDTASLVNSWIAEKKLSIDYVKQHNQGMHSAHNTAYSLISTELNVCIDSDDYMPDDAIENILSLWKSSGSGKFAGIIGLDAHTDGRIVGTKIPENIKEAKLNELYQKYRVSGDKKLVLRTEVVREFPPYPVFEGEKLVPLGTLYRMIDEKYTYLCSNDVYCIVEYLPNGSSNNILKQYRKSPNGFRYARQVEMKYEKDPKRIFTRTMQLVSSSLFSRRLDIFKNNPHKLITFFAVPFGVALHGYILWKTRK